jgi:hypothetical protein
MPHVHDAIFTENQYLTDSLIELARAEAKEKFCSPDRVLFSREHLTGWTHNKGLIAERLKQVFGDVKVILMIREQIAALESLYLWELRNLARPRENLPIRPFDAYVERQMQDWNSFTAQSSLMTYDYGQLAKHYVKIFGRDNVGVFLFEELAKSPNDFLRNFHRFMDINCTSTVMLDGKKENARLTTWQFAYWYATRYLTPYPINWLLERTIPQKWLRLLEKGPPMVARLSEAWRNRLESLYAPGNQFLVQEFGLPLGIYGYSL